MEQNIRYENRIGSDVLKTCEWLRCGCGMHPIIQIKHNRGNVQKGS